MIPVRQLAWFQTCLGQPFSRHIQPRDRPMKGPVPGLNRKAMTRLPAQTILRLKQMSVGRPSAMVVN